MKASLLVELLSEELPPKSLASLSEAFGRLLLENLQRHQLVEADSDVTVFATPRRLAARIAMVSSVAPSRTSREKILPVTVAFDAAGSPTAPLKKKLAAMGLADLDVTTLERASDGKAETLYLTREIDGSALTDVMTSVLASVIEKLPIAKLMSYQINPGTAAEATVRFARPAHGLVVLFGSDIIDAQVLGLRSGRTTLGHRFLSSGPIDVMSAHAYEDTLKKAFVVASLTERRSIIEADLLRAAGERQVIAPSALIDEVTALVEWPVVIDTVFDAEFLVVPQECLILTMQQNQKYFALTDASGKMTEHFLLVSNLQTADNSLIVHGNQRVLRARLADAKFFFEQDKKRSLESRLAALADVIYLKKLGTLGERVQRLEILARELAESTGADLALVSRAARLAKADLSTDMVGEFPELQGTMGRYYALNDGEPLEVASAIAEHYRPRFAADALPTSAVGVCVAMADKLESLAGFFAINEIPTGERDPYALRRSALGVLRMLMDAGVQLDLTPLLTHAVGLFAARIDSPRDITSVSDELKLFMFERLRGVLRERGYQATEIEAVLSLSPERVDQVTSYLDAVRAFAALPEAASLASANKRIGNILKKNPVAGLVLDQALYAEPAEHTLGQALTEVKPGAEDAFSEGDYTGMLSRLARLRDPVDQFFADVMVMAEDPKLRANRMALLAELHGLMNRFADLSKLVVAA